MLAVVCFCMDRAESKSNREEQWEGCRMGEDILGVMAQVQSPLFLWTGHMEWKIFVAVSMGNLCDNLQTVRKISAWVSVNNLRQSLRQFMWTVCCDNGKSFK